MIIGEHDTKKRVFIIAEIGNNHEGDLNAAFEMIDAAKESGADAVKFQTFKTEYYAGREDKARFSQLKNFELSYKDFSRLAARARKNSLYFLSTPLDLESARFLLEIADAVKIASSDNNFYPLIDVVARGNKPQLISTGMISVKQIKELVDFVRERRDIARPGLGLALLHCVTSYPVKDDEANLNAVSQLKRSFKELEIGYSDHTLGYEAALIAVGLGARIVEKHFTLDKNHSDFRDHRLSSDPEEMSALVSSIRRAEAMLKDNSRRIQKSEKEIEPMVRRSIASGKKLQEGHILLEEDLAWLRPAGGLAPGQEKKLVGRRLVRPKSLGEIIKIEDIE